MTSNNQAYPDRLSTQEVKLLRRRDKTLERAEFGLALSGGGIRSATFAFGVIQALARNGILRQVHVLSTVSGGGYTGSLLTRLFARREIKNHDDVRRAILPASEQPEGGAATDGIEPGAVLRWLRNNGRYLAPKGSGATLHNVAVLLRNWLSVHIVLATLVLASFVLMQFLRDWAHSLFPGGDAGKAATVPACVAGIESFASLEAWLACHLPLGEEYLWWSPWVLLPALPLALAVVPFGWVYWLAPNHRRHPVRSWAGLFVPVFLLGVAYKADLLPGMLAVAAFATWLAALCIFVYCVCASRSQRRDVVTEDAGLRNWLSSGLKTALMAAAVSLALALVDTLGQTVYAIWRTPERSLSEWFAVWAAMLGTLATVAQRLTQFFGGEGRKPRFRPAWSLLAMVAAGVLWLGWLVTINAAAHGITWHFDFPQQVPKELVAASRTHTETCGAGVSPCPPLATLRCESCVEPGERIASRTLVAAALLWILSVIWGRCWTFLNNSTLLPLYTARLTRAFLGASNRRRLARRRRGPEKRGGRDPVTRVVKCDDLEIGWGRWLRESCSRDDPFAKGAPLHLVNVTINETLDGAVQLHRADRKGIGMAVGPAGLSAGVRHHVVFGAPLGKEEVFPEAESGFQMFGDGGRPSRVAEERQRLSLGQWAGISGAAFSTGLGTRTNLGFSLLAGLLNVRLGFWWDSGVDPDKRCGVTRRLGLGAWLGRWFTRAFPVQSYLLDEFLGRFHGTARRHWCLTDGGHFDNMGAYELVRRRVPLMVILDAEADPEYVCDGLGKLVASVRADFGAEIEFLGEGELGEWAGESNEGGKRLAHVGTLEMLRPETAEAGAGGSGEGGREVSPGSRKGGVWSRAHAAVARVTYRGEPEVMSVLVYVKPTLLGDEPADVTHYRATNPDFPHQPTVDQFFDEWQWESYRKLGEVVAERVLTQEDFEVYRKQAGLVGSTR